MREKEHEDERLDTQHYVYKKVSPNRGLNSS